jgi:copper chaperone CopZ
MKQPHIKVTGMSCSGCEGRIEGALCRLDGVIRAKADHPSGQLSVVIDPARASEQAVHTAIKQAGYGVSS